MSEREEKMPKIIAVRLQHVYLSNSKFMKYSYLYDIDVQWRMREIEGLGEGKKTMGMKEFKDEQGVNKVN